jgi:hypothetical protein
VDPLANPILSGVQAGVEEFPHVVFFLELIDNNNQKNNKTSTSRQSLAEKSRKMMANLNMTGFVVVH